MENSKVVGMEREATTPQVEVEMNGKTMEVVIYFKCLGVCISRDQGPQDNVKISVVGVLKKLWCYEDI